MPRFIDYDYNQTVLLPVAFESQILPGTFEHSIHYLVDNQLDLKIFDSKYKNAYMTEQQAFAEGEDGTDH